MRGLHHLEHKKQEGIENYVFTRSTNLQHLPEHLLPGLVHQNNQTKQILITENNNPTNRTDTEDSDQERGEI